MLCQQYWTITAINESEQSEVLNSTTRITHSLDCFLCITKRGRYLTKRKAQAFCHKTWSHQTYLKWTTYNINLFSCSVSFWVQILLVLCRLKMFSVTKMSDETYRSNISLENLKSVNVKMTISCILVFILETETQIALHMYVMLAVAGYWCN